MHRLTPIDASAQRQRALHRQQLAEAKASRDRRHWMLGFAALALVAALVMWGG